MHRAAFINYANSLLSSSDQDNQINRDLETQGESQDYLRREREWQEEQEKEEIREKKLKNNILELNLIARKKDLGLL